jgi:acetyl esterase/lipase
LTALDAGFFTAMSFKPSFLKHTFSILFSMYYLLFTDAAEEKVRRYHKTLSVEVMRNSWDKVSHNPFLRTLSYLIQPKMSIRDILTVDRPEYHKELPPVEIYRYYYKPKETYADNDTILLQIHGGGFVAMNPVCHEDPLCVYAQKTGLPIISINYKKAPEYPFPWPIEECFDFYVDLVESKGKNVGLKGEKDLNIILICDSA